MMTMSTNTTSSSDFKQQFRQVFNLAKQFDQQKQAITNISQIFNPKIEVIRSQLVDESTSLIYQTEYEAFAKKSREILWFKGFYDLISLAKRFWKRNGEENSELLEAQLSNLIIEGIAHFKSIIVRLEHDHALDLRYIVDFSFLDTFEKNVLFSTSTLNHFNGNGYAGHDETSNGQSIGSQLEIPRKDSIEVNRYALETIHALLISLGDLHRYFIEFNFRMPKISKDFAANYYFEAFKLNPKTGMAHNQLGTLLGGQNYDLDSIYHYLYSLICAVPFELSDINVNKLFQANAEYLEESDITDKISRISSIRDIVARFIVVIDVFFNDKEVADLNSLCHCTLIDLRGLFQSERIDFSSDMIFKMVSLLLFCLTKLQTIGSSKVHHLNAFLLAICSEILTSCTAKVETFIEKKNKQSICFQLEYSEAFERFEHNVRNAREKHRRFIDKEKVKNGDDVVNGDSNGKGYLQIDSIPKQHLEIDSKLSSLRSVPSDRELDGIGGGSSGTRGVEPKSSSSQTKQKNKKLRRRRKRFTPENYESDFSQSDNDFDMDSDFSSDSETDEDEMNSNYSTDYDDEDEQQHGDDDNHLKESIKSDNDDILIEEEELVYLNGNENGTELVNDRYQINEELCNAVNALKFNFFDGNEDLVVEEEKFVNPTNGEVSAVERTTMSEPEKLRYKQKYDKKDPNIVIEFVQNDPIIATLKIFFDWLRINSEILINCFATNPEFIDKIFTFLNLINIDIFTRKVYFERNFIKIDGIRDDLRTLFDTRVVIPIAEDVLLKELPVLDQSQHQLNWTMPLKLKTTTAEEAILRVFKLIDFGFFVCKMKKFRYNFCSRGRRFVQEVSTGKRRTRKRTRNKVKQGRKRQRGRKPLRSEVSEIREIIGYPKASVSSNEDTEESERKITAPKKSYLKNRGNHVSTIKQSVADTNGHNNDGKQEMMGKLWLQHEIEILEAKISKTPLILTPYLVVDTKCMIQHLSIVKNLVKSKKFVVLIPKAVLAEMDDLKKTTEDARNSIRWLEQEFTKGSRFIRLQRNNETLSICLLKIPKKLDREASTFVQIATFSNYMNENYTAKNEDGNDHNTNDQARPNAVTILTGDKLGDKKASNLSFTGILNAAAINFEQITTFYGKYKKK